MGDLTKPGSVFSPEVIQFHSQLQTNLQTYLRFTPHQEFTKCLKLSCTYKFHSSGTHLVRLHYSPFKTQNYDLGNPRLIVSANEF